MNITYIIKLCAVGGIAEAVELDPDNVLEQLQKAVGGYIERVPLEIPKEAGSDIDCFVDEEGLLKGIPAVNGPISRAYGATVVGDAVFAKHNKEGNTVGFTPIECAVFEQWLKSKGAQLLDRYGFPIPKTDKDEEWL